MPIDVCVKKCSYSYNPSTSFQSVDGTLVEGPEPEKLCPAHFVFIGNFMQRAGIDAERLQANADIGGEALHLFEMMTGVEVVEEFHQCDDSSIMKVVKARPDLLRWIFFCVSRIHRDAKNLPQVKALFSEKCMEIEDGCLYSARSWGVLDNVGIFLAEF